MRIVTEDECPVNGHYPLATRKIALEATLDLLGKNNSLSVQNRLASSLDSHEEASRLLISSQSCSN